MIQGIVILANAHRYKISPVDITEAKKKFEIRMVMLR